MSKKLIKIEIEESFLVEAYEAACSEWKDKLRKKFPEVLSCYKIGDRFLRKESKEVYILAQAGLNSVCLVNLDNGRVWDYSVVVHDLFSISHSEFKSIVGSSYVDGFELIQK